MDATYIEKFKNDRVSSILTVVCFFLLMIMTENKYVELLYQIIALIVLVIAVAWTFIILPKIKNPTKLSNVDNKVIFGNITLFFVFLCLKLLKLQIFPTWTQTALILVLFVTLVYFALSNPAPAQLKREIKQK